MDESFALSKQSSNIHFDVCWGRENVEERNFGRLSNLNSGGSATQKLFKTGSCYSHQLLQRFFL